MLVFESFCNTTCLSFFSTESVDKSVGKLFNGLPNAVMLVFVTNWSKSDQTHKSYIYQQYVIVI